MCERESNVHLAKVPTHGGWAEGGEVGPTCVSAEEAQPDTPSRECASSVHIASSKRHRMLLPITRVVGVGAVISGAQQFGSGQTAPTPTTP